MVPPHLGRKGTESLVLKAGPVTVPIVKRDTRLAMRLWLTLKQLSWQQISDQPTERA